MTKTIIIGRSGSGKSTLLQLFENEFKILTETAREVLDRYTNQRNSVKQVIMMYKQWEKEESNRSYISDRSLIDYVAFSLDMGIEHQFYLSQLDHRYDFVFKLPNRKFQKDNIRIEKDEDEADRLQQIVDNLYLQTNNPIIQVPYSDSFRQHKFITDIIGHGRSSK